MKCEELRDIDHFCSKWQGLIEGMSRRYTDDESTKLDFQQQCFLKLCVVWRDIEAKKAPAKRCAICDQPAVIRIGVKDESRCAEHYEQYVRATISNEVKSLFKHGWNFNMMERDKRPGQQRNREVPESDAVNDIEELADSAMDCGTAAGGGRKHRSSVRRQEPYALRRLLKEESLMSVMNQVGSLAQAVVQQIQEPGDVAFKLAEEDYRLAERRRKSGELVMNLNRLRVCKKHIAQQLNVSPASISRAIAEIEAVVEVS
jgi:hypothetical protein